ncbi:MAG: 50S ribosomal protein L24 [Candidatus Vogelbacteria bacterium]|nr:50S ribosomal protein L24 [Candidatus Vogelbacteria bacterium]
MIKKGQNVIVVAGKDKGKTGKVLKAFPALEKVLVEGVNISKRHQRARKSNQTGQVVDKPMPMHVSNVMIVDPKTSERTRVGAKLVGDKKVIVTKKSGTEL